MKRLKRICLYCLVVGLFSACSGEYAITYATNPSGANIICNGVGMGFSPLTLNYDTNGIGDDGILHTAPCKGVFVSGYEVHFSTQWDTRAFPDGIEQTATRPQGAGYEQDIAFSLEYERNRMLQQQVELQEMQLWQQQREATRQRQQQQMQQNKSVFCHTVGNMTVCN